MHFLSVCVCIKNERPFLAEFVRHYLAQGVDHVYIVDNGSTDHPETLPECSDDATVTIIRDVRNLRILGDDNGSSRHSKMVTENLFVRLRNETQWAILVDADEFMFGKNGLKSYVRTIPDDVNRVYVFWNIITPPCGDDGVVPETFSLAQNRRRINYDKFDDATCTSDCARFANRFGKSIFRPMQTDLGQGLWLHKVFVHGRAITNYGHEEVDASTFFTDNLPHVAPHSEAAYHALDVTLHHYALRNRADCDKKTAQLTDVPFKTPFIVGLFDLLRNTTTEAFVEDTLLPALPAAAAPVIVVAVEVHHQDTRRTRVADVVGFLDAAAVVREEYDVATTTTTTIVHLKGWALSLTEGANRRVRYVYQKQHGGGEPKYEPLDAVRRDDVARAYGGDPRLALCGWDQHIAVVPSDAAAVGWLEIQSVSGDTWVHFMDVVVSGGVYPAK